MFKEMLTNSATEKYNEDISTEIVTKVPKKICSSFKCREFRGKLIEHIFSVMNAFFKTYECLIKIMFTNREVLQISISNDKEILYMYIHMTSYIN